MYFEWPRKVVVISHRSPPNVGLLDPLPDDATPLCAWRKEEGFSSKQKVTYGRGQRLLREFIAI